MSTTTELIKLEAPTLSALHEEMKIRTNDTEVTHFQIIQEEGKFSCICAVKSNPWKRR